MNEHEWQKLYLNGWIEEDKLLIAGHTTPQIERWARLHGVEKDKFIRIRSKWDLAGRNGVVVILPDAKSGDYQERWESILEVIEHRKEQGAIRLVYGSDE